jgi:hypothetical protein
VPRDVNRRFPYFNVNNRVNNDGSYETERSYAPDAPTAAAFTRAVASCRSNVAIGLKNFASRILSDSAD